MESKGGQINRLNAQVLEGLSIRVDHLVNELPLNLVRRDNGPPEQLVQVVRNRLQDRLGNVDVTAVLDDFTVNQLGNFGSRVVLGTVKFESLTSSGVIVKHTLQSIANIGGLFESALYPMQTD